MEKRRKYIDKLDEFFILADKSGDGNLTFEEFQDIVSKPEVKAYLTMLEVECSEVSALYEMLVDETDTISYEAFLAGILKLKGQARSFDVLMLARDNQDLKDILGRIE